MNELYKKLKNNTLIDVLKIEESDRQFIALKNLEKNIENKDIYLALIIANSIICYQLSWKWEDYWEEFSSFFSKNSLDYKDIIDRLWFFIENSKNNKRFIDTKKKRLEKLKEFLELFYGKSDYFYQNMTELRDILAKTMNQKKDAKTIVFAVKMFWYWARNIYDFVEYPFEIFIPIDSRLINLFEKYKENIENINDFYLELSNKLSISPLHLDWLVWINYEKLLND